MSINNKLEFYHFEIKTKNDKDDNFKIKDVSFTYNKDNGVEVKVGLGDSVNPNKLLDNKFELSYSINSVARLFFEFDNNKRHMICRFVYERGFYQHLEKLIVDYLISKNVSGRDSEIIIQKYFILLTYYKIKYEDDENDLDNSFYLEEFDNLLKKELKIDALRLEISHKEYDNKILKLLLAFYNKQSEIFNDCEKATDKHKIYEKKINELQEELKKATVSSKVISNFVNILRKDYYFFYSYKNEHKNSIYKLDNNISYSTDQIISNSISNISLFQSYVCGFGSGEEAFENIKNLLSNIEITNKNQYLLKSNANIFLIIFYFAKHIIDNNLGDRINKVFKNCSNKKDYKFYLPNFSMHNLQFVTEDASNNYNFTDGFKFIGYDTIKKDVKEYWIDLSNIEEPFFLIITAKTDSGLDNNSRKYKIVFSTKNIKIEELNN